MITNGRIKSVGLNCNCMAPIMRSIMRDWSPWRRLSFCSSFSFEAFWTSSWMVFISFWMACTLRRFPTVYWRAMDTREKKSAKRAMRISEEVMVSQTNNFLGNDVAKGGVHVEQLLLGQFLVQTVHDADRKQDAGSGAQSAGHVGKPRQNPDEKAAQDGDDGNVAGQDAFGDARVLPKAWNLELRTFQLACDVGRSHAGAFDPEPSEDVT